MSKDTDYKARLDAILEKVVGQTATNEKEAKILSARLKTSKKELDQLKRELNQEVKAIQAHYRQEQARPLEGTSLVLGAFGKRKLAGQLRADKRRALTSEKAKRIEPYDHMKRVIDDIKIEFDSLIIELQALVEESKAAPTPQPKSTLKRLVPKDKKRFCTQCGSQVGLSDVFCKDCGHAVTLKE